MRTTWGFAIVGLDVRTMSSGAHPNFCSGRTSNIGHQFLASFLYLYPAAVPGRQLVNSQPSQSPTVSCYFYAPQQIETFIFFYPSNKFC